MQNYEIQESDSVITWFYCLDTGFRKKLNCINERFFRLVKNDNAQYQRHERKSC